MLFTKEIKIAVVAGLMLSSSYVYAVIFTGGPVIDGPNISKNVAQNIEMIERHLRKAKDWKALQDIVKEKVKGEFSREGSQGMTAVKHDQDLNTSLRNHEIEIEMAPMSISGCGDDETIDDAVNEASALFQAFFRDMLGCLPTSGGQPAYYSRRDFDRDKEKIKYPDGTLRAGSLTEDQKTLDDKYAQKLSSTIKHVKNVMREVDEEAKNNAGRGATSEEVAKEKAKIINEKGNEIALRMTEVEDQEGNVTLDLMSKALSYLTNEDYYQLDSESYNEALDLMSYMMGYNEQKVQSTPLTDADKLTSTSKVMLNNYPYISIKSQFDDRLPTGNNKSKLEEIRSVGEYYATADFIGKVGGADNSIYQVEREKLIAKSFKAYVELEKLKKYLERERTLALRLVQKL